MDNNKEQKNEKKQQKLQQSDIDKLMGDFENNLNLTNQQQKEEEEDPEVIKKIKEQYEKFMAEMGKETGNEEGEDMMGLGNLGKAFQQLMQGFGAQEGSDETGKNIGSKLEEMFKNIDNQDSFENAATELLNQFMDKSLLQQPLQETKQNYQKYFEEKKNKNQQIPRQHQEQFQIIKQLLSVLEKTPEKKQQMISLFTKLQEKGTPPEGIAPSFGVL